MNHTEAAGHALMYALVQTSSSYSIVILVIYVGVVIPDKRKDLHYAVMQLKRVFIILIAGCFQFSVNRWVYRRERRRKGADETLESPYDEEQVGFSLRQSTVCHFVANLQEEYSALCNIFLLLFIFSATLLTFKSSKLAVHSSVITVAISKKRTWKGTFSFILWICTISI